MRDNQSRSSAETGGAVVLVISARACPEQQLAVAALLDASGLMLLAPDDLIERYLALIRA